MDIKDIAKEIRTSTSKPVVKYWAVEIDGWSNSELVFGEEMTSVQALAEVSKGIVRESLRAPVEITKGQYLREIKYRNS